MTASLSDFNYHIIPGDVLLLVGTNKAGSWNLAAQRLLRPKRDVRFTHVALVLNNMQIADAIPHVGVSIRNWQPLECGYDIDRSVVARHPSMAVQTLNLPRLLERVRYYIDQPYVLTALARSAAEDQAGIVCSQFVSLVLNDLGISPLTGKSMKALPADIDHATRGPGAWRQFPFAEYGLCSRCVRPATTDPYWQVLAANLPSFHLDENDRAKAKACANDIVTSILKGDTAALDSFLRDSDALCTKSAALSAQVNELVAKEMSDQQRLSRTTAEFDRMALETTEMLSHAAADPIFQKIIAKSLPFQDPDWMDACSGLTLLNQWRALFVGIGPDRIQFMHDTDAPDRLRRHRSNLANAVGRLLDCVTKVNEAVEQLTLKTRNLPELLRSQEVSVDSVSQMWDSATLLRKSSEWIGREAPESIEQRLKSYEDIAAKELLPWSEIAEANDAHQALDLLIKLQALDAQRQLWISASKPLLDLITDTLGSLFTEGGQEIQAPSVPR